MKKIFFTFGAVLLISSLAPYAISSEKSDADQRFVNEAAQGGMVEVELGQLAQKNGSSDKVKRFGRGPSPGVLDR